MRKIASALLDGLLRLLPSWIKVRLIRKLTGSVIDRVSHEEALRFLFEMDNYLYCLQGRSARAYGGGIHTKHKHLRYHDFFIKNINPGESVLDVGSGNGYMAGEIASRVPDVRVVGLELSSENIRIARERCKRPNLQFIQGDVLEKLPDGRFDVVTLSNVLEHFEHRVDLLKRLDEMYAPRRFVIRVPLFERDWRVPLKKELGLEYRLDATHFIEYTQEMFLDEIQGAGLEVSCMEIRWGEIWSVLEHAAREHAPDEQGAGPLRDERV